MFCAYEVEACTGPVKVNVSFDMRLHCRGLKPKRRLLLPNPNLPDQISDDVSASRLIASASIRPHPPVELLCAVGVEAFALRKTPLFFEFSLCLFGACLGKMIHFYIKMAQKGKKTVFTAGEKCSSSGFSRLRVREGGSQPVTSRVCPVPAPPPIRATGKVRSRCLNYDSFFSIRKR